MHLDPFCIADFKLYTLARESCTPLPAHEILLHVVGFLSTRELDNQAMLDVSLGHTVLI